MFKAKVDHVRNRQIDNDLFFMHSKTANMDPDLLMNLKIDDSKLPMLMIIEYHTHMLNDKAPVYLYPSDDCKAPEFNTVIYNHSDINDFIIKYSTGKLAPYIANEDIDLSYSKYPALRELFNEVNITKINSKKVYDLAQDPQSFRFIIIVCKIWDQYCIDFLYEINAYFGSNKGPVHSSNV